MALSVAFVVLAAWMVPLPSRPAEHGVKVTHGVKVKKQSQAAATSWPANRHAAGVTSSPARPTRLTPAHSSLVGGLPPVVRFDL